MSPRSSSCSRRSGPESSPSTSSSSPVRRCAVAEFTYRRPVPLQIAADEVLREFGTRPHLMLRIAIRGDSFPHRALEPSARIDLEGKTVESLFTEVDEDERGMRAYFATDVPLRGTLTV